MNQVSYNSKELLSALMEMEANLKRVISKNYPSKEFLLTEDTDKALEELLQYQSVEDDNAGYISTELALFYLRQELEKTIDIIVIANDLRACHDYKKDFNSVLPEIVEKPSNASAMFVGVLIGIAISLLVIWIW